MQCQKTCYGKIKLCQEELEHPVELEYYHTKSSIEKQKNYGIGITKKYENNKEIDIEQKEINNIITQENEAIQLLQILLRNQVTPIGLKDVLEDLISL